MEEGMLANSEFETASVGSQAWRYHDSGQGRPVVLIHGFPDTPESYASIARSLNEAGYRTILPYLRGYHPDTIVPGRPYDAVNIAEDAIGLLDVLELESAVLVGHDWGASLIYGAAVLAPERVDAIVPIAIPHPSTLKPRNALQALGLLVMARHFLYFQLPWCESGTRRNDFKYVETLYDRWAPEWQGPERDAAVARAKEAFSTPEVLRAAIDYYRAVSTKLDRRLTSAAISGPTRNPWLGSKAVPKSSSCRRPATGRIGKTSPCLRTSSCGSCGSYPEKSGLEALTILVDSLNYLVASFNQWRTGWKRTKCTRW
jgi:pimeloyl-ACP methyl ester carboxylesterase